ncbi:MAG: METTL5 family protein [Candidatus Nanohaloarchaeota archaeon QJJ-7]|nr:METTL5 family protein [Candidatus Nanohaloarchaeota archaeon QJJ-7]
MDKTRLQMLLSRLKPLEDPDAELEQYRTSPDIAADVLNRMELEGALEGRAVDLGCGNGVFAIGAGLLGGEALGIDSDMEAVETARENLERVEEETGENLDVEFKEKDVKDLEMDAESAVTNPPFGVQKRDMNRVFLRAAFETAPLVYAILHRSEINPRETQEFLQNFASDNGFEADVVATYDFPLPRTQEFHEKEKKYIKVDLYRFLQV